MNALGLIIEREYYERVKRRSFIITTILVPILMLGLMAAPALLMLLDDSESKNYYVIDNTGIIAPHLKSDSTVSFTLAQGLTLESLRSNKDTDGILIIPSTAVDNPEKGIALYSNGSLALPVESTIKSQLQEAIQAERLNRYDIPDLQSILKDTKADVQLTTRRLDKEDSETSSMVSYALSLTMDMLLYMFILIYGQMVMTSIIEEKTNRVLEIVVTSVKPMDLMMGKIAGVGLVAITQILIWVGLLGIGGAVALPFITPSMEADPDAAGLVAGINQFTDGGFIISLVVTLLLFFIGGFLFYASIYAAIGSAVSNVQDGSQLSTIATMPVIMGIVGSTAILKDPDCTLAFWLSVIPFTSPMSMMARIPYGVPLWEVALSVAVLYASFAGMVWLCGRIYRIGIFMYGKKPTIGEMLKWARYKN